MFYILKDKNEKKTYLVSLVVLYL